MISTRTACLICIVAVISFIIYKIYLSEYFDHVSKRVHIPTLDHSDTDNLNTPDIIEAKRHIKKRDTSPVAVDTGAKRTCANPVKYKRYRVKYLSLPVLNILSDTNHTDSTEYIMRAVGSQICMMRGRINRMFPNDPKLSKLDAIIESARLDAFRRFPPSGSITKEMLQDACHVINDSMYVHFESNTHHDGLSVDDMLASIESRAINKLHELLEESNTNSAELRDIEETFRNEIIAKIRSLYANKSAEYIKTDAVFSKWLADFLRRNKNKFVAPKQSDTDVILS